jgi:DNA gyrase subunit B
LKEVIGFFTKIQRISNGLHRHGLDPEKYFEQMNEEGKFPVAKIRTREKNGLVTEEYAYTDTQEAEIIAEAEKRLTPENSTSQPQDFQTEENPEEDPTEKNQAPPSFIAGGSVDVINIFEAKACEDLAKEIQTMNFSFKDLFVGEKDLFEIGTGGPETTKVNSIKELFEEVKKNGHQGMHIQRYKGLGEMNAEQLWETTMDPEKRKMLKVSMEDAVEAERMFTLLMGDVVEPRREYIEKHAAGVKDLDI